LLLLILYYTLYFSRYVDFLGAVAPKTPQPLLGRYPLVLAMKA